jgi:hypothetical protein
MKTKETTCKKCGGFCKPSKAFINLHNIQHSLDISKPEFETNYIDCLKCESCGHSYVLVPSVPEVSTEKVSRKFFQSFSPALFKAYISKFSRIAQAEMLHLFICIFFQDVLEETFENETEFSNSLKHVLQNLFVTISKDHIEKYRPNALSRWKAWSPKSARNLRDFGTSQNVIETEKQ